MYNIILDDFINEKSKLQIEQTVSLSYDLLKKSPDKALSIMRELVTKFEKGIQLQNTSQIKYCTFENDVEYYLTIEEINNKDNNFLEIIKLPHNYSRMYYLLGYLYQDFGFSELAENSLLTSLKWNPCYFNAHGELAEVYKILGNKNFHLKQAYNELKFAKNCKELARAFRDLGFNYIDNNKYEIAAAIYLHSLHFDTNPIVRKELEYIQSLVGKDFRFPRRNEILDILVSNNIQFQASEIIITTYNKLINKSIQNNDIRQAQEYKLILSNMLLKN